jgi:hypothetical protein
MRRRNFLIYTPLPNPLPQGARGTENASDLVSGTISSLSLDGRGLGRGWVALFLIQSD